MTLKGSGSAGSLFDQLSSAEASISDAGGVQLSQRGSYMGNKLGQNTQKFYHMSYVETVEPDAQDKISVR